MIGELLNLDRCLLSILEYFGFEERLAAFAALKVREPEKGD